MWEASLENAKQPPFGICDTRSIWLQVPSFPRAHPRMCRREPEVWAAALILIEAHSHLHRTFLDGGSNRNSGFTDHEASRMIRGGRKPTVRGALYEGTSIAAMYDTIYSLVWESWGSPELWYASTRKPRGKWLFCEAKLAFPPTWRVLECGKRVWKTQNSPPSASGAFEAFG